jgi:hypothetical protein
MIPTKLISAGPCILARLTAARSGDSGAPELLEVAGALPVDTACTED